MKAQAEKKMKEFKLNADFKEVAPGIWNDPEFNKRIQKHVDDIVADTLEFQLGLESFNAKREDRPENPAMAFMNFLNNILMIQQALGSLASHTFVQIAQDINRESEIMERLIKQQTKGTKNIPG